MFAEVLFGKLSIRNKIMIIKNGALCKLFHDVTFTLPRCPASRYSMSDTDCRSDKAFYETWKRCQGQRYCRLSASNSIYGDPCRGTVKYLIMQYRCSSPGQCSSSHNLHLASTFFSVNGFCDRPYVICYSGDVNYLCGAATTLSDELLSFFSRHEGPLPFSKSLQSPLVTFSSSIL